MTENTGLRTHKLSHSHLRTLSLSGAVNETMGNLALIPQDYTLLKIGKTSFPNVRECAYV